jgi:hypothetical protein
MVEGLADQRRTHGPAVPDDEAAVGLVRERELRDGGHDHRIGDARDYRQHDQRNQRGPTVS